MKPIYFFLPLVCAFAIFSFRIYSTPIPNQPQFDESTKGQIAKGKLVYQKYNCQSCHQIYGLGGYLGPDLTNCMKEGRNGELLIKTLTQVGTTQMPSFPITETEMENLIAFFKALDQTGNSDPRHFIVSSNGMIAEHE
jgi:nitric oxide reductase subunit C